MEQILLRDKIKEFIGESKVVAACFFSYNFDSDFFENYLLPLFIPEAPFNDNKIQNSILWRKYSGLLPPITVVCEFHAKGSEAPNLDYDVIAIDMPRRGQHKPVFHCKLSFILTKDERLLVMNGSNNLTYSGWCRNIECFTCEVFKNGKYFPKVYKDQYLGFLNYITKLYPGNSAFKTVKSFFNKQIYTEEASNYYWNSGISSFQNFLSSLIMEEIQHIEVFSPFIYGDENLKHLKPFTSNIRFSIPFEGSNVVGMKQTMYYKMKEAGVQWCLLKDADSSKEFRFNHSKIYKFKGIKNMYTIIGSVNFTEMAWVTLKEGGNFENAVVYVEDVQYWNDLLNPYMGDAENDFRFVEKDQNDNDKLRLDVPRLNFILNWQKGELFYNNYEEYNCKWVPDGENKLLKTGEGIIKLTMDHIGQLSKNPAIKILYNTNLFIYYPKQTGMDFKPLPANLKLNNEQIFKLWEELLESNTGTSLNLILEALLRDKTEEAGEWIPDEQSHSILNQMAAHLSGIIHLEKALFPKIPKPELLHYYLVVDNIDTIWGYLNCLKNETEQGHLQKGFSWLIMEIIRIKLFDPSLKCKLLEDLQEVLKFKREDWIQQIKEIRKQIPEVDEKLLKWTIKQL